MRSAPESTSSPRTSENTAKTGILSWLSVICLVYLLLVGVAVVGAGFKWVSGGAEGAAAIFSVVSAPLAGVILGTLATALVQSSSTVTSVIVGLVAGGVPVSIAVPMIMGANMGTTITNTIVSLGNLREKGAFTKSFQAATVHDFFNLFSILIFLPIEIMFQPLERMAGVASSWLIGDQSASMSGFNFMGAITKPVANGIVDLAGVFPATVGGLLVITLGIAMIMTSVIYLGKVLRGAMTGRARVLMQKALGRRPETGVLSGAVVTVLVQSSSTTTSLIVPLAGSGIVTLKQVFPFTMGANIGTCITALLAATAIVGENEVFALQIALVHLLYNVLGVLFFLYIPWLKALPIRAATWLGERAGQHKGWAFGYIFALFFVMPGSVFAGDVLFDDNTSPGPELDLEQLEQCQIEVEACGMSVE